MSNGSLEKNEAPVTTGASKEGRTDMSVTDTGKESAMPVPSTTPENRTIIDLSIKPEHFDKLWEKHQRILLDRAVPIEYALRHGLGSVDLGERKAFLEKYKLDDEYRGLPHPKTTGIWIEYFGCEDGRKRARIRVDEQLIYNEKKEDYDKIPRYLAQKGIPIVPYFTHAALEIAGDASKTLYIVEAPIKALSMSAHGYPSVGLGGVSAGLHDSEIKRETGEIVASKDWRRIDLRGRKVVIVYDAMVTKKPEVALGAAMSAIALAKEGADVWFAFLPIFTPTESDLEEGEFWRAEDQGPDDYLAREGKGAMQAVIDAAVPALPDRRIETTSDMRALLDDLTFQAMLYLGGTRFEDDAIAALKRAKCGYRPKVIADAVKQFRDALTAKAKADSKDRQDECPYAIHDGKICMNTLDGPVELTNFHARIVADVMHDDGTRTKRYFAIEGGVKGSHGFPRIEVPASEFSEMKWPVTYWGSSAIVRVGPKFAERTREAIQMLSKDVTTETVYEHTGWRVINDKRTFLHGGLSNVRMGGTAVNYVLPEQPEDLAEAVKYSLGFLGLGPLHVTAPLLAMMYLSPLSSILHPDFVLWLSGQTGSRKSGITGVAMQHFGKSWNYKNFGFNWESTDNAIELALNLHADVPTVIDNYIPQESQKAQETLARKAHRIVQAVGDQASRQRLTRDAEARASRPPRGTVIVTGEDLQGGTSTLGRIYSVRVEPDAIPLEGIVKYSREPEQLGHAMAGYVDWIAENWDEVSADLHDEYSSLQAHFHTTKVGVHPRQASAVAYLMVAFNLFLRYAIQVGAIAAEEAGVLAANVGNALLHNTREQGKEVKQRDMAAIVLDCINSGLPLRKIRIAENRREELPGCGLGEVAIGWDDPAKDRVYVLPDALITAINEYVKRTGTPWPRTSPGALYQYLAKREVIEDKDAEGRYDKKVSTGGKRHRCLVLFRHHIAEALDTDPSFEVELQGQSDELMDGMDDLSLH